jgi:hypothetical protein
MDPVAYWQHRQKTVALDAKEEALIERDLAGARQGETEALKDNVISFSGPEDESVVRAPAYPVPNPQQGQITDPCGCSR